MRCDWRTAPPEVFPIRHRRTAPGVGTALFQLAADRSKFFLVFARLICLVLPFGAAYSINHHAEGSESGHGPELLCLRPQSGIVSVVHFLGRSLLLLAVLLCFHSLLVAECSQPSSPLHTGLWCHTHLLIFSFFLQPSRSLLFSLWPSPFLSCTMSSPHQAALFAACNRRRPETQLMIRRVNTCGRGRTSTTTPRRTSTPTPATRCRKV